MKPIKKRRSHAVLLRYARALNFGNIHTIFDPECGMHAIIAVHNTTRGPALGGCRFRPYESMSHALEDVLRLSSLMTLKAAAANLAYGGAKSVIIEPSTPYDREAYLRSYARSVHSLQGQYICAMDVGTTTADMTLISEETPFVVGCSYTDELSQKSNDPSPYTALGVLKSIEAAIFFQDKKHTLDGLRVAIQGVGKVGGALAELLINKGAEVTVCDTNANNIKRLTDQYKITVVNTEDIYDVPCDIFCPCALGGSITSKAIKRLSARIIAGAANNQLAHHSYAHTLHAKGILYLPDFVINSGGLIQAVTVYEHHSTDKAEEKVTTLFDRVLEILENSARTNQNTLAVAEQIAKNRLNPLSTSAMETA